VGLERETEHYEWHGVKCGDCAERHTIKIKKATLSNSHLFTKEGVYICERCKKKANN